MGDSPEVAALTLKLTCYLESRREIMAIEHFAPLPVRYLPGSNAELINIKAEFRVLLSSTTENFSKLAAVKTTHLSQLLRAMGISGSFVS